MLLLNNRNILNITEEDYNILLNTDINFELLYNDNTKKHILYFFLCMTFV
jgi:hypothetical protein